MTDTVCTCMQAKPSKVSRFDAKNIISVAECIGNGTKNFHYVVYSDFRTEWLQRDMKKRYDALAKTHPIQGVDRNFTGPSTAVPWVNLFMTLPYNKGAHPFNTYFNLMASTVRGEQELWSVTFKVCRNMVVDDWWLEIGNDGYGRTSEDKISEEQAAVDLQIKEARLSFSKLCEVLFSDLEAKLTPLLSTTDSSITESNSIFKRFGISKASKQQEMASSSLRQSNMLFIRLDILSIFLNQYGDMR